MIKKELSEISDEHAIEISAIQFPSLKGWRSAVVEDGILKVYEENGGISNFYDSIPIEKLKYEAIDYLRSVGYDIPNKHNSACNVTAIDLQVKEWITETFLHSTHHFDGAMRLWKHLKPTPQLQAPPTPLNWDELQKKARDHARQTVPCMGNTEQEKLYYKLYDSYIDTYLKSVTLPRVDVDWEKWEREVIEKGGWNSNTATTAIRWTFNYLKLHLQSLHNGGGEKQKEVNNG